VDQVQELDRFVERVAGLDGRKAELKGCVRIPGDIAVKSRELPLARRWSRHRVR